MVANRFGFHGRPIDVETGLQYFRNRYYDPELGRFVTADPLGYVDGPSMYQFAGYSPGSFGDPLGLESNRQLMGIDNDLVDRPVLGVTKWLGYGAWNFVTFGFLAEHDEIYEQTSGGDYLLKTGLAVGKSAAKLAVVSGTAGAGVALGEAAGLGVTATGLVTGI